MAARASLDESNRNNLVPLAIQDVLPLVEVSTRHERARADARISVLNFVLRDEPLWKQPGCDPRPWRQRIVRHGRLVCVVAKVGRVAVFNPDADQALCFTLEAAAFRQIGGFSDELFVSEEIDLSKRLKILAKQVGKKIVILHRHPLEL